MTKLVPILVAMFACTGCKIWHYDRMELTVRDAKTMQPVHGALVAVEHGGALIWEGRQAKTDIDTTDIRGIAELDVARNAGDAFLYVNGERFNFEGERRLGKPRSVADPRFDVEIRLVTER
jgi:hypothetical protein